jgi:hypothetical protein
VAVTAGQRYEVLGRVATTRAGNVWKARDIGLDRLVALKQTPMANRDALYREAAAIAALASEHVVAVYGVEEDEASAYLVEEWVDGATVATVVRHNGRMPAAQALGVLRGALLGLAAAHRAGMVHGDVSLSNILVDAGGTARLIDFGSVAAVGGVAQPATGAFAAPEVAAGRPATPAADVYAAAAVLATLLHGRFEARPSTQGIDGPVRDVLNRALSIAPEQRYPDAAAFLAALDVAASQAYGIGWWTQAGLGAAAVMSVGALVPTTSLVLGGAAATAGSGGVAASAASATATTTAATTSATNVGSAAAAQSGVGVGRTVGRVAWHSRRALYAIGAGAAATAAGVTIAVAVSSGGNKPAASATNLIRNPGAEDARPDASAAQVPVRDWTLTDNSMFTAGLYGISGLPSDKDPGPSDRGKNLFTGGPSGDIATATQADSLSTYAGTIKAGNAKFSLSGWLGGYSSQTDNATLTVTWRDASGGAVGTPTAIGPVTADDRHDATGLLFRSASGAVPKQAASALITLRMMRNDGTYVDGYADNLSLIIVHT